MLLEQVGVFLFDRRATLERLARLVGVFGVRRPKGADRLRVAGIECLDKVVGGRADCLLIGLISQFRAGGRTCGGRVSRLSTVEKAVAGRQGDARCEDQQDGNVQSHLFPTMSHG